MILLEESDGRTGGSPKWRYGPRLYGKRMAELVRNALRKRIWGRW